MNEKIKNGLQTRLGHGYAKFGRAGSVWRWEFSWLFHFGKGENKAHGYDKGYLEDNTGIFERLKTRFLKSVILDNRFYEKATNFKVYLCDKDHKQNDELIFTLRFFRNNGTIEAVWELSDYARRELSQGSQNYLDEILSEMAHKIRQQSNPHARDSIKNLITEINQQAKPQEKQKGNQADMFWANLVKQCFSSEEAELLRGITAQTDNEKGIFYLSLNKEQYDFLENESFEKWANYFRKHLPASFRLEYLVQQETPQVSNPIQQQISNIVQKFKV